MDIRVRKLKGDEGSTVLSRSLPTSRTFPVTSKTNCFQRCLNTSTDSLNSNACVSPKLGQYRKLPNKSECDMCHEVLKDVTHLKCFHSTCQRCMDKWKIEKTGCPVCIAEIHDLRMTSDDLIFDDFDLGKDMEQIELLIKRVETEVLQTLTDKHNKLKEEQVQLTTDAKEQIDKINEHVGRLKQMIDEKADNLIKLVRDSETRHLKELVNQDIVLKEFIQQVTESVLNFRRCSETREYSENLKLQHEEAVRRLAKLSQETVTEDIHVRFNVKPITDNHVDALLGKVGVRVFLVNSLEATLSHTHTFPAAVQAIRPISSEQAWVGYLNHLQLCSKRGYPGQKIDVGGDIHDLCLDEKGDLLIACQNSVKLLKQNLLQTLFTLQEPLLGISCRKDGAIVACVRNRVIVYNKQGIHMSELKCNGVGELKMPYKVVTSVTGDVCVTDCKSTTGDVAIFNNAGTLLAKIRTEGMAPRGVACSHQGLIYVCDFRSDRINIYSTHGHFLQTIVTSSHGLSGPLSVALDPSGDLWVGDWKRNVKIFSLKGSERACAANSA